MINGETDVPAYLSTFLNLYSKSLISDKEITCLISYPEFTVTLTFSYYSCALSISQYISSSQDSGRETDGNLKGFNRKVNKMKEI